MAFALSSYLILDLWSSRNGPIGQRFQRLWYNDVRLMEDSGKLPKPWWNIKEVTVVGGTPDTKKMLRQVAHPIKTSPDGQYNMEILIVYWEEEGVRGVLVQYNIEDIKSRENVFEEGRTLVLSPRTLMDELQEFRL